MNGFAGKGQRGWGAPRSSGRWNSPNNGYNNGFVAVDSWSAVSAPENQWSSDQFLVTDSWSASGPSDRNDNSGLSNESAIYRTPPLPGRNTPSPFELDDGVEPGSQPQINNAHELQRQYNASPFRELEQKSLPSSSSSSSSSSLFPTPSLQPQDPPGNHKIKQPQHFLFPSPPSFARSPAPSRAPSPPRAMLYSEDSPFLRASADSSRSPPQKAEKDHPKGACARASAGGCQTHALWFRPPCLNGSIQPCLASVSGLTRSCFRVCAHMVLFHWVCFLGCRSYVA